MLTMKIEAVIVCVNYADFLAHTLASTRSQFDRLVIVTDHSDLETKNLCQYYNVQCVQTDVFYEDGDTFNKGKGINEGLKHLDLDGWVVHIDADIYLPPQTRHILESLPLDESKIYGADRLMCPSYKDWLKFQDSPSKLQDSWIFVHLTRFPVGVRVCEYKTYHGGYEPIGYFQLWNPSTSGVKEYPDKHGFADRTDVIHCKKWPREKRELLPEIVLIHLESEPGFGLNWKGRKTEQFCYVEEILRKRQPILKTFFRRIIKKLTIFLRLFRKY
jgi:glycosyltransferase involved in cell wall biosynthesis